VREGGQILSATLLKENTPHGSRIRKRLWVTQIGNQQSQSPTADDLQTLRHDVRKAKWTFGRSRRLIVLGKKEDVSSALSAPVCCCNGINSKESNMIFTSLGTRPLLLESAKSSCMTIYPAVPCRTINSKLASVKKLSIITMNMKA
jgi:hypothetical protein